MDFNIDELVSKYFDPLKNGNGGTAAASTAAGGKKPEPVHTVPAEPAEKKAEPVKVKAEAPESRPVEPAEEKAEPVKVKAEAPESRPIEPAPEPKREEEVSDDDKPEDLSDFLKDILDGGKLPKKENIGATREFRSVSSKKTAEKGAVSEPDDVKGKQDDRLIEDDAENIRVAPVYKTFEPEKYAVDADPGERRGDEDYFRDSRPKQHEKPKGFEKFADMPEGPEDEVETAPKVSRKPLSEEKYEEIFRKQEMPSPAKSRAEMANDLLSHIDNVGVEAGEEPVPEENDEKKSPDYIDRTAIMGNLFSKFKQVEREADIDAGAPENKPEEPVHNEGAKADGNTRVFGSDPVPAHMTEPAERAGVAAEKNKVRIFHTGELQPLHEFSGNGTRDRVSITDDFPMREEIAEPLEGQMSFFEFPEPERGEQIDEEAIERDVNYRRLEKAKNFHISKEFEAMDAENNGLYDSSEDNAEEEDSEGEKYNGNIPEYNIESDRRKISWFLLKERRKKIIATAVLAFITFCFALLEILPVMSEKVKASMGRGIFANSLLSFILLMVAAITLVAGTDSISLKRRPDGRSVGLIAVILAVFQSVGSMFAPGSGNIGLLAGSVSFVLLISSIASYMEHERVMRNFKFCAYTHKKSLSGVVTISGDQERREIGQSLDINDPVIKYSCKVNFPRRFIELSYANRVTDNHGLILLIITGAVGAVVAAICGLRHGSYYALSGVTAAFCAATPIAEYFSITRELKRSCRELNESGGMISSLNAARKCSKADAVIIDAAELIDKDRCELHGLKDFKNVRLDDFLLYAAALGIRSESPLAEVFRSVVVNNEDVLPPVTAISIEENLGVSGWIHGQKVLLGNRNLMAAHNIAVPTNREEASYCENNRKALYIAIADKLAAMFVVSYAVDMSKAAYLHCLKRNNITVFIDSCDPNVSEEMLEDEFGLGYDSIKVISSMAGRIFLRLKDSFFKKADATVLHDGKSKSFLMSIASAVSLRNAAKLISVAQIVTAVLSLLVMVTLAISANFVFINSWFIAVLDVISIAAFMLICRFFRV